MNVLKRFVAVSAATALLLGSMPSMALANASVPSALEYLRTFKIVQGDERGNLMLDKQITRAELMTILVRADGKENLAPIMKGATSFSDIAPDDWYSGYVALAKSLGLAQGYPDGTFKPNNPVTYAEMLTMLARQIGIEPTQDAWPQNYLVPMVTSGAIPEYLRDIVNRPNDPAIRGDVFQVAENAFLNIKGPDGKTLFQRNFDSVPPVISIDPVSQTSAPNVTISGKVHDAVSVTVNGQPVMINFDGSFAVAIPVSIGDNVIEVVAKDGVGNEVVQTLTVRRVNAPIADMTAPAEVTVKAGQPVDLGVVVTDANGEVVESPELTIEPSEEGLVELVDGTLVAGQKVKEGTVTVKLGELSREIKVVIVPGDLAKLAADKFNVAPGTLAKLSVKGYDAYDNEIAEVEAEYSLAKSYPNVLLNKDGHFIAEKPGTYEVVATVGDISATFEVGVYGDTDKIGIYIADKDLVANTTIDWSHNAYLSGKLYDVEFRALDKNGHINLDEDELTFDLPSLGSGVVFYEVTEDGEVVTSHNIETATFENGVFRAKMGVLYYWGGEEIELTTWAHDSDIQDAKFKFKAAKPVATGLTIEDAPEYIATNDGTWTTLTVRVVDQTGVVMEEGSYDAKVTVSGPATVNGYKDKKADIDIFNGEGTFDLYTEQGDTGDIRISITAANLKSAEHVIRAVLAGKATKFAVEITDKDTGKKVVKPLVADGLNTYVVTIRAVDSKGIPTTSNLPDEVKIEWGSQKLTGLTFDGTSTTAPKTLDLYNGVGSFEVTSTSFVGEVKFTVKADGYQSATGSFAFVAGQPVDVEFTHKNDVIHLPIDNPKVTLTVQLQDSMGNPVAKSGEVVKFIAKDGSTETSDVRLNGRTKNVTVRTDAKGQASVTVETIKYPTSYTIEVEWDGQVRDTITLVVDTQVVSKVNVYLLEYAANPSKDVYNITAGDTVAIKVVLEDQYRRPVPGKAEYLNLKVDKILWDAVGQQLVDNTDDTVVLYEWSEEEKNGVGTGVYWLVEKDDDVNVDGPAAVQIVKAGLQNVNVEYTANPSVIVGRDTVTVKAGSYATPVVLKNGEIITSDTIRKNKVAGPYVLRLTDGYGNFVSTPTAVEIDVIEGSIRSTPNGANLTTIKTSSSYNFYFSPTKTSGTEDLTFDTGMGTLTITFTIE